MDAVLVQTREPVDQQICPKGNIYLKIHRYFWPLSKLDEPTIIALVMGVRHTVNQYFKLFVSIVSIHFCFYLIDLIRNPFSNFNKRMSKIKWTCIVMALVQSIFTLLTLYVIVPN